MVFLCQPRSQADFTSQHWKCFSFKTFCLIRHHSSIPVLLHLHKFLITSGTTPVIYNLEPNTMSRHASVGCRIYIPFPSPNVLGILWKPWEGALFFPWTFFLCGKLSQLHDIMLSASPSTVSLGSDLPSQHSITGIWFLFGMLRAASPLSASLVHRSRQEREGFCQPSCSKDRPTSSCTPYQGTAMGITR